MTDSSKGVLLVVDDEPLKRATLQIELAGAGYTVFEAADAQAAAKVIETRPVDVVITDVRMPEMDGIQLLELVKSRSPRTHVILMTAYGTRRFGGRGHQTRGLRLHQQAVPDGSTRREAGSSPGLPLGGGRRRSWRSGDSRATRSGRAMPAAGCSSRSVRWPTVTEPCWSRAKPAPAASGWGRRCTSSASGRAVRWSSSIAPRVSPRCLEGELFGSGGDGPARHAGRLEEAAGGTLFLDEIEALLDAAAGSPAAGD